MTNLAPLAAALMRAATARHMRLEPGAHVRTPPAPDRPLLLYIHVPFCEVLCPFCSFHRVRFERERAERHFGALRREIALYHAHGYRFDAVYVGGGTPTVLPAQLAETLAFVRDLYPIRQVSVETNPDHLTGEVLDRLADAGVDRLSVGVQSFDDTLLRAMQRYDKYGSGAQILDRLARAHGRVRTLNVDMIFNLPRQSADSLARDIGLLAGGAPVDQVSYYPLMTSPTTRHAMAHTMGQADSAHERQYYYAILDGLSAAFTPSSAWCFSRQRGAIDEYIVDHDEYVGVGSGALSYVAGVVSSSTFSIGRYIRRVERGMPALTAQRTLGTREQMRYDLLMKLFGLTLDLDELDVRYDGRLRRLLRPELLALRAIGAVRERGGALQLTRRGMYLWVVLMREFFNGVNRFREQMRANLSAEWEDERAEPLPGAEAPGQAR